MINRTTAFRAFLLASATVVPATGFAQSPASQANQSGVADAIRVLLDQATYWRSQYQQDKADEAVNRVLTLDPRNADALALQAQMAADRGNTQLARSALAKLQAARPDDPRIATIDQSMRIGPVDPAALADARALAAAGKHDEAIAAYRRMFHGDVPPGDLAVEYYQTLSTTEGNFEAGRAGLANVLRGNPQDLKAQLAYAELLTYNNDTRTEGLDRLNKLVAYPAIAEQATRDLRQALTWLPVNQSSLPEYNAFLAQNPGDAQITERVELARNDTAGLRVDGFDSLQAGKIADAETNFNQALGKNPNDADALVGLALVRLRQNRAADGRALLRHAIEVDPEKQAQYQPLIDSTEPQNNAVAGRNNTGNGGGNRGDFGAEGRRIRGQYAEVAALTRRGEYAQAEALLRKLAGNRPNIGNYLQLADIQARSGKLRESEASYRTVLRSQPRNVAALGGLAGVLSRDGQTDEANRIFGQVAASGGGTAVGQNRAAALRQQAQQVSDPVAQIGLYRSAVAADPSNPWIRLELARVLLGQNREGEARQEMTEVTSNPKASADQLRAGVYFADNAHDYPLALSLVSRLPEKSRTPEMRDVGIRSELASDLRSAKSADSDAEAARLVSLAAKPDPTGIRGAAFAQELVKQGNKRGARDVIRAALAARPPMPQQRIAYAGALVGAGYPDDAQRVTAGLQSAPLNPLERSRLTEVNDNAATFSADNLNGQGKIADAYDKLAPNLARNPDNPDLNMALARLYQSNKQPKEALRIDEELLRRNPSSPSVRNATVSAAIAAGDYSRARSLVNEAKEQSPDDPQVWILSSQLARARGDDGGALADLRQARTLRQQQLNSSDIRGLFDRSNLVAAKGPRYALNIPANTATDVPDSLPVPAWEPVTREYERYAQNLPPASAAAPILGGNPVDPNFEPDLAAPPSRARASLPPVQSAPVQTVQTTQNLPGNPAFGNPFRPSPAPTLDEPSTAPNVLGGRTPDANRQPADPLTQDIDRSIAQVQNDFSPRLEGSLSLRGRSGAPGQAQLFDVEAPIEASYSPAGYGRLKVQVTPAYLYSGKSSAGDNAFFGTNPLLAGVGVPGARNQSAGGTALDVGYAYNIVSADIGSTPLGFQQTSIVGGIEIAPRLTDNLTLRIVGDRRAVTDSLLSYGGTKDVLSGQKWGGVTRDRGHGQLEGSFGIVNYYAGAGGGVLTGEQVKSNTEVDAGAGLSFPVYTTPTQEVRVGTNLVYFAFKRNLEGFTIGNGGYFSPQQFFAVLFPVTYRQQLTPDLTYTVGGSVGYQTFRAKSEEIFPTDSTRQNALVALAAANPAVATRLSGFSGSGVAGGANASVDYRVTDNFHIGGKAGFDRSGNFTEGTGLIYGRYVFNDPL